MANVTLGGFRPWGTFSGGQGNFPTKLRGELANNYNTAIFRYDIIKPVSDGTVAVAAAGDTTLLGVAVGFSYVISGKREPRLYIPANTTFSPTTVGSPNASWVYYHPLTPDLILEVDVNTAAGTKAALIGWLMNNCDLAAGSGGSTTSGISSFVLDTSAPGSGTANFRIIDYRIDPTNDLTLVNAKVLVTVNEGVLPAYTATGV